MSPRFRFEAVTPRGRTARGYLAAESVSAAAELLVARGDHPLLVVPAMSFASGPGTLREGERALLIRNLAALIGAAVPMDRALGSIADGTSLRCRKAVDEASRAVREGAPLSRALEQARLLEGPAVGMLRAGERAGRLSDTLDAVAHQLEASLALRGRVRQALTYPAIVLTTGVAALAIIGGVVVPRLAVLLADLGQELPPLTAAVIGGGRLLALLASPGGLAVALGLAAGVVLLSARPGARSALARVSLRVPVAGQVIQDLDTARFCLALTTGARAAVPMHVALPAAAEAMQNRELRRRAGASLQLVLQGRSVHAALRQHAVLSAFAMQLLSVGESGAALADAAARAARLTADAAQRRLDAAVALIQPLLIAAIAAVIGVVAGSLLQALYAIRPL